MHGSDSCLERCSALNKLHRNCLASVLLAGPVTAGITLAACRPTGRSYREAAAASLPSPCVSLPQLRDSPAHPSRLALDHGDRPASDRLRTRFSDEAFPRFSQGNPGPRARGWGPGMVSCRRRAPLSLRLQRGGGRARGRSGLIIMRILTGY